MACQMKPTKPTHRTNTTTRTLAVIFFQRPRGLEEIAGFTGISGEVLMAPRNLNDCKITQFEKANNPE